MPTLPETQQNLSEQSELIEMLADLILDARGFFPRDSEATPRWFQGPELLKSLRHFLEHLAREFPELDLKVLYSAAQQAQQEGESKPLQHQLPPFEQVDPQLTNR